jgi:hypothetical protein
MKHADARLPMGLPFVRLCLCLLGSGAVNSAVHGLPETVRYDFSPLGTLTQQKRKPILAFLINTCAIVGGLFTTIGILLNMGTASLFFFGLVLWPLGVVSATFIAGNTAAAAIKKKTALGVQD